MNNLSFKNSLKVLPIIKVEFFAKEICFLVPTNLVYETLLTLKNHFKYQFKILTCISGLDYPQNLYRFQIVYELLSIKFNTRMRVKIFTEELLPINSLETLFPGAAWWECEIWDMFGIFFSNHSNLTRLLTDYGFQGYPLRKDFPLSGFNESRYHAIKNRIVYGNIELCHEYRTFEFSSPWEKF